MQVMATGTLASDATATDSVCLDNDGCYSLEVGGGEWQSEVSWTLGTALSGGAPYGPLVFSVTAEGEMVDNCDTFRAGVSWRFPSRLDQRSAVLDVFPKTHVNRPIRIPDAGRAPVFFSSLSENNRAGARPAPTATPAPSFSHAPTLAPTLSFAPTTFAREVTSFAELVEANAGSEAEVAMTVSLAIVFETSVGVTFGTNRTVAGVASDASLVVARSSDSDSETRLLTASNHVFEIG